jgi:hypothetical protein
VTRVSALILALVTFALPREALAALDSVPESGRLAFAVLRDGGRIGTHTAEFRRDGDALVVETRIDIAVKLLFVTVYRFTARRTETWRGDALVALDAETDDNGDVTRIAARAMSDTLAIEGPKGAATAPGNAVTTTYWNRATVEGAPVIDATGDGIEVPMVERLGASPAPGGGAPAEHFRLSGVIDAEVWYRGPIWVGLLLTASDGSRIEYVAEPPGAAGVGNGGLR